MFFLYIQLILLMFWKKLSNFYVTKKEKKKTMSELAPTSAQM
jgi:hypothetical protein